MPDWGRGAGQGRQRGARRAVEAPRAAATRSLSLRSGHAGYLIAVAYLSDSL